MAKFFSANRGLSSRVPHHIAFEDYSHDELMQIAELMVESESFRFDDSAREAFAEYLTPRMEQPRFSNARSVRNAIEGCWLRQARRLVSLDRPLGCLRQQPVRRRREGLTLRTAAPQGYPSAHRQIG